MRTLNELKMLQGLPLEIKVEKTKARIREFVNYYGVDGVYVSFSGGKDSTVLLHIVRSLYPQIEGVFVDTGLEYPEIKEFVKTFDNITIVRPKMTFLEVIKNYGYPMISKDVSECVYNARFCRSDKYRNQRLQKLNGELKDRDGNKSQFNLEKWKPLLDVDFKISNSCCGVIKKKPAKEYEKKSGKHPLTAQMASESRLRAQQWLINGCNGFEMKHPISNPMSFWTEQDVLQYIKQNNLKIASVYGDIVYAEEPQQIRLFETNEKLTTSGCKRTGCVFCGFGCHLDKHPNRFEQLKQTHPKLYDYCIGGGEYDEQGIWKPNKKGLGIGHCFDELNKIYGEDFIKYN